MARGPGKPFTADNPKPGPGRPKGSYAPYLGIKRDFLEFLIDFRKRADYQQSLAERLIKGKAPHVEALLAKDTLGEPERRISVQIQAVRSLTDAELAERILRMAAGLPLLPAGAERLESAIPAEVADGIIDAEPAAVSWSAADILEAIEQDEQQPESEDGEPFAPESFEAKAKDPQNIKDNGDV